MRMNSRDSLKRALTSILAAAMVAAPGAFCAMAQSNPDTIVLSGSGRSLTVKETTSRISDTQADRLNDEFNSGFDAGYKAGYQAGLQKGYKVGAAGATSAAPSPASLPIDTSSAGGTDRFQRGYRAGYRVGYTRAYNAGLQRGYNDAVYAANRVAANNAYANNAAAANAAYANGYNGTAYDAYGNPINPAYFNGGYAAGNAANYYGALSNLSNATGGGLFNPAVPASNGAGTTTGVTGLNTANNSLNAFTNGLAANPAFTSGFNGNQFVTGALVPNNGFNNGIGVGFNNTGLVNTTVPNNFNAVGNLSGAFNNGFNTLVNQGLSGFTLPFANGFNNVTGFNSNFANNLQNFNGIYLGNFNNALRNFTGGVNTTTGTVIRR